MNKRSFYTSPSGTKWDNPSKYGSGNSGWSSFMSHDLFYYKNWSFVHDDSVKFFFKDRVLKHKKNLWLPMIVHVCIHSSYW